jgi:anti-sigma factor RsiW
MNTTRLTLPDDELFSAWLDGELGADEHNQVQAWLKDHPDDAARVRAWAADRDALRVRLDASLAEPLPQRWVDQLSRPPAANEPRWLRRALVAGLMLTSGLGGAWLQRQGVSVTPPAVVAMASTSSAEAWLQRAAAAHAVYVPEQRHPVEVAVQQGDAAHRQQQSQHLGQWLSKRLAMPVTLFNLSAEGFELVGGRLLPEAQGSAGAQLMYQRADGERVTVYVLRHEAPPKAANEPDVRFEQVAGLDLMVWYEDGAGCALVGKLPRTEMRKLADVMYAQAEEAAEGTVKQ